MKILQVIPAYYPAIAYGGPMFSIHYASQALARSGAEIRVATSNANYDEKLDVPTRSDVQFEPHYVVRYYKDTWRGRFSWAFTFSLSKEMTWADVVHLQDVYSPHAVQTLLLAAWRRRPVLISPRGIFSRWALNSGSRTLKRFFLAIAVRPLVGNAKRVAWHATSAEERSDMQAVFPGCRVFVVPNGLDCATFAGPPRLSRQDYLARFFPRCAVPPDRTQILAAMGRLHAKKSFDVALEAFRRVDEAFPNTVLLIAGGDDGERSLLQRYIDAQGLQGRATLVGEVRGDDKIEFLKGADVFLFPSHSENFGMAALEAMAAGLPTIASRNAPWAEIETFGAGAWVGNTPDAFAEALRALLTQDLSPVRERARQLARRYGYETTAALFNDVYMRLKLDNERRQ